MRQILEQYGFYMYKQCRCGGSLKQSFKHLNKPGVEFFIRPNKNIWVHLLNKKNVDKGNLTNLDAKLQTV